MTDWNDEVQDLLDQWNMAVNRRNDHFNGEEFMTKNQRNRNNKTIRRLEEELDELTNGEWRNDEDDSSQNDYSSNDEESYDDEGYYNNYNSYNNYNNNYHGNYESSEEESSSYYDGDQEGGYDNNSDDYDDSEQYDSYDDNGEDWRPPLLPRGELRSLIAHHQSRLERHFDGTEWMSKAARYNANKKIRYYKEQLTEHDEDGVYEFFDERYEEGTSGRLSAANDVLEFLGLGTRPSITQCQKAVRGTYINIFDYVEGMNAEQAGDTARANWIRENRVYHSRALLLKRCFDRGFYPKDRAKTDSLHLVLERLLR